MRGVRESGLSLPGQVHLGEDGTLGRGDDLSGDAPGDDLDQVGARADLDRLGRVVDGAESVEHRGAQLGGVQGDVRFGPSHAADAVQGVQGEVAGDLVRSPVQGVGGQDVPELGEGDVVAVLNSRVVGGRG